MYVDAIHIICCFLIFLAFFFPPRHISVWNSVLWLQSGKVYTFTRKVSLLASSIWNQKVSDFLKTDIDSYFNNRWKQWKQMKEAVLYVFIIRMDLYTQTHSAYIYVLPLPHKLLFPYALHTEYICASFTTPQRMGTR